MFCMVLNILTQYPLRFFRCRILSSGSYGAFIPRLCTRYFAV